MFLEFAKISAIDFSSSAWQFSTVYGQLISHDQKVQDLDSKHIIGTEIDYVLPSSAFDFDFSGHLKFPQFGLGLVYLDLGNPELTGQLIALYPFLQWNVIKYRRFTFNLKPGVGVSYLTKTYNTTHQINKVIGSKLNVYFALGTNLEFRMARNLSLVWDLHANHASNGNFKAPNIGYNIVNSSIGLKFYSDYDQFNKGRIVEKLKPDNKYYMEIIASGGQKELYYKESTIYPVGSLVIAGGKNFSRTFKLGLGADFFYNQSYAAVNSSTVPSENTTKYLRTYIAEDKFSNRLRAGISVQPELVFNKLSVGIHCGLYIYNPIRNLEPYSEAGKSNKRLIYPYEIYKEDGWFYSRAALKYTLNKNLFISLGLKTHLNKSEFIEWGLGYKLF